MAVKVIATEPRGGPWANDPQWGNTWQGPYPPNEDDIWSVAGLDAVPGPPRVVTVNLGRSAPTYAGPGNSDFRALITYGVGAVSRRFECDWRNGAQLSVVANSVRVDAKSIRSSSAAAYSPAMYEQPELTAAFARGEAGRSRPPTWSTPLELLAAAGTKSVIPPLYADRVCLLATSYPAAFTVAFRSQAGLVAPAAFAGDLLGPDKWVPIPVGQTRLLITNGSVATVGYWLVFELAL